MDKVLRSFLLAPLQPVVGDGSPIVQRLLPRYEGMLSRSEGHTHAFRTVRYASTTHYFHRVWPLTSLCNESKLFFNHASDHIFWTRGEKNGYVKPKHTPIRLKARTRKMYGLPGNRPATTQSVSWPRYTDRLQLSGLVMSTSYSSTVIPPS